MQTLSIKRFGFAIASASIVSYLGCVFVMLTVPKDVAIRFFNSLMHVGIFVLGWLFGALIACCYNCCGKVTRGEGAGNRE